uniref:Uncharacterized protein n=1 Tax=Rhizochromulina marina TaxID=1034831 RepID=A0A7S2SLN3_9STRA|mmetsp:Transcript_31655/g.91980  ORF Transcript_31655/g.91980 Transcript_31655/m.91980 type:complete len:179 (+) Transcript_31655:458-994(+)
MILLVSNDAAFETTPPETTAAFLQSLDFDPDVILLGSLNSKTFPPSRRLAAFSEAFPNAGMVPLFGIHLPPGCRAAGCRCTPHDGHQCLPGFMDRAAEKLVARIADEESYSLLTAAWNSPDPRFRSKVYSPQEDWRGQLPKENRRSIEHALPPRRALPPGEKGGTSNTTREKNRAQKR